MAKKTIINLLGKNQKSTKSNTLYDWFMMVVIIISLIPLMTMDDYALFIYTELGTTAIFIIDYILRWTTADYLKKNRLLAFLIYPFTPMAILDLLSILPTITILSPTFRLCRSVRLLKITRLLRIFGISRKFRLFVSIFYKERQVLSSVCILSILYIFITALILFNVEPHINPNTGKQTFQSFFDALYWATVTLTTVGYGDICPVTDVGRLISMLSSFIGIAIIALPSGVITARYMDELRKADDTGDDE